MPEFTSASTFLGNKDARTKLCSLWIALDNNDLMCHNLIAELNDLISDWKTKRLDPHKDIAPNANCSM